MKKLLYIISVLIVCSCVSKSKYDNLQNQYYDLEWELRALKREKSEIRRTLEAHDIQIEELDTELDRYDELLSSARETITNALNEVEKAEYWLREGSSFLLQSRLSSMYNSLKLEEVILINNGY